MPSSITAYGIARPLDYDSFLLFVINCSRLIVALLHCAVHCLFVCWSNCFVLRDQKCCNQAQTMKLSLLGVWLIVVFLLSKQIFTPLFSGWCVYRLQLVYPQIYFVSFRYQWQINFVGNVVGWLLCKWIMFSFSWLSYG